MSTYRRPLLLKQQLEGILKQSFPDFEVVISDNDPDRSAENIITTIGDPRLKYFPNMENLGMMQSFNKSIERSQAEYITMITDDDPILPDMLEDFHKVIEEYPTYGIYIGCTRVGKKESTIEIFDNRNFLFQILNPQLTTNLLWSSCVLKKKVLVEIGGVPEFGSPHLADHAMMALCGNSNGGVIINKMYSKLTSHDSNFSKDNINSYYIACLQFYKLVTGSVKKDIYIKDSEDALIKHLDKWFISNMFNLRKYFTYKSKRKDGVEQINSTAKKILQLDFMRHLRTKYYIKLIIFYLKKPLYLLNILR